jgi:hypothetical protein
VSLFDLFLHKAGQNVSHPIWQWRSIVTPTPNRHFRTTERSSCGSVAAKGHFENEVVPPTGKPPLEVR